MAEPHNATLCCDRIGLAAIWQLTDRGAPLGRTVYRSGSRDYGGRASARRSLSLPDRIGLAADWLQRLIAPLYQTASVRQLTGGRASALCVPRPHRSAAACVGRALACRSAVTASVWQQTGGRASASVWQQTGGRASARRSDETASVLQLTGARASARPLPAPPTRAPYPTRIDLSVDWRPRLSLRVVPPRCFPWGARFFLFNLLYSMA